MLVEDPIPGIPLENVLLVVGRRRELLEPLLGDADLALGRAGVDLFEAVGGGVDQVVVGEGFEEGVAGEANDLALLSVEIDGEDLDDAVGDFLGLRGGGGGEGGSDEGSGGGEAGDLGGELLNRGDRHG